MVKDIVQISLNRLVETERVLADSLIHISGLEKNLGCVDGKIIGTGRSDFTQSSTEYDLTLNGNKFVLIDIPGIEGDESKYKEIIKDSLAKAHVIFYVNGSGKKIEKDSLEKIKNYMHDGTSVYAVFNVHCKGKKNRIKGIDKTYQEELYEKQMEANEIVRQTEEELKSFLGHNYKGSVSLNGLLSFCAAAVDQLGGTTIVANEDDRHLRDEQDKFIREYSGNFDSMYADGGISKVQEIITGKIDCFDEYIREENLKKLRTRLTDMLSDVTLLRNNEKNKIRQFLSEYDRFESNCEIARDICIHAVNSIGSEVVEAAFSDVREELFDEIERHKGKLKQVPIEEIFSRHEKEIAEGIQSAVNKRIKMAEQEYRESIMEAEARLCKDLQSGQRKFEISMGAEQFHFDSSFKNGLDFTANDFMRGAFKIGTYTLSGFTIGSVFPVVGNIAGALIGALVGVAFVIVDFFSTEAKRINRAKEKVRNAITDQISDITRTVKKEIKNLGIDAVMNERHVKIQGSIATQKRSLQDIERMMDAVVFALEKSYSAI